MSGSVRSPGRCVGSKYLLFGGEQERGSDPFLLVQRSFRTGWGGVWEVTLGPYVPTLSFGRGGGVWTLDSGFLPSQ